MNRWLSAFLRLFFRLLYHEFAWSYDLVAWIVSLGRWKSWVLSVLPYVEGPRVLELGPGPGHLQIALAARKGIHVYGLDASRQMVRLAARRMLSTARRLSQKDGNPESPSLQPRLVIGESPYLPYPSGYFDQILATFPTQYIFQQPTLLAIKRILRPGGSLLVIPAAWITGRSWLERLAAGLFHVTRQAPAWDEHLDEQQLAPFARAGLVVTTRRIRLQGSEVMLILAEKPLLLSNPLPE